MELQSKTFKKGEVIFKEGQFEMLMYDIRYGKVGIYSDYEGPDQKLLTELEGEDYFGEMGLLDSRPRSATAVALEKTEVSVIDAKNFDSYFETRPAKVMSIMQHMSSRLRDLSRDYMEACHTIAEYLEAEEAGEKKSAGLIDRMKKFVNVSKKFGR